MQEEQEIKDSREKEKKKKEEERKQALEDVCFLLFLFLFIYFTFLIFFSSPYSFSIFHIKCKHTKNNVNTDEESL